MGEVWRVRDQWLQRDVALKQLGSQHAADALATRAFLWEAQVTSRLEHPGIVPIYDIGTLDGRPSYTMKEVRGTPLAPGQDAADVVETLAHTARALAFAHAHGLVHRDVKPDNILVGPFGEVLVVDWGLVFDTRARAGCGGGGTPGFMAPEQGRPRVAPTPAADVYALGV
ncbi:MAG: serine/threonine protein kinase, partial [Myxococcales bacterium]|nr:serine/threonine protein kinase [Myxococcales bacterium]